MTKPESSPKDLTKLFFVSSQFWICNTIAWVAFGIAQALRYSFDGSPLLTNIIKIIPTCVLGVVAGLCIHFFYTKWQLHKRHPIRLIPMSGLIAIVFAGLNICINRFDLVISIPEICSREYPRPPYSCGEVSDLFLQSLSVMLIWCLFYFLIQTERKNNQDLPFGNVDIFKAAVTLFVLNYLGSPLTVIAYVDWGSTHYLFSRKYFIDALSGFPVAVIFALYIIFIKPGRKYWGSRILPLLPAIIIMSLCFSILCLGAQGSFSRLYATEIQADLPLFNYVYYILFGSAYGSFGNAEMLAGVIQGEFTTNLLIVLFLLTCKCSTHWEKTNSYHASDIKLIKSFAFWSGNFLFWTSFGLLIYSTDLMDLTSFGESVPLTNTIAFAWFGVFIGLVLRLQIENFIRFKTSSAMLGLQVFITSLVMGVLLTSSMWLTSYTYIFVVLHGLNLENYTNFVNYGSYVFASILVSCILCGLWAFICYMIESQKLHRNAVINQLQIEKNLKEVQLNALAGKVDPHFVFNALNNIRALVDEDKEKARSAIVALSDILRSPMTNSLQNKIHIMEEMLLVRNYIALSKIQYEDGLNYEESIDENAELALIPAMMLQILVENAIKHGISQLPDGGILSLHIYKDQQNLVCKITNDGSLRVNPNTSGFGIGIKAVRERLALLYNQNASFSLHELNYSVVAELILPFELSI